MRVYKFYPNHSSIDVAPFVDSVRFPAHVLPCQRFLCVCVCAQKVNLYFGNATSTIGPIAVSAHAHDRHLIAVGRTTSHRFRRRARPVVVAPNSPRRPTRRAKSRRDAVARRRAVQPKVHTCKCRLGCLTGVGVAFSPSAKLSSATKSARKRGRSASRGKSPGLTPAKRALRSSRVCVQRASAATRRPRRAPKASRAPAASRAPENEQKRARRRHSTGLYSHSTVQHWSKVQLHGLFQVRIQLALPRVLFFNIRGNQLHAAKVAHFMT